MTTRPDVECFRERLTADDMDGVEVCDYALHLESKHQAMLDVTIDFIDQMRVQGYDKRTLPAEYDTLVDLVKGERTLGEGE